jgi:hypothetical protein
MKRFTFWNACLWFSFLIVVTQSAGVTITGDIKVSTFSSDGETLVDQGTYSFQVSGDGHKWSMRVEYGEQYHELNGSDGTNTWTVNCNSDAEFRKVFGARADRATYPATVALVPCPFAATSAGRVVWLALASSSLFATNSSPFIPALWGEPVSDPIPNAIETSRAEFIEGSPRLPSRLEFFFSSRKLLENPRFSPYMSTSIPESTIKSAMTKVKDVEGHRIGLYTVVATTNFEGETFPLSFQLDVFARDPAKKRQMYFGTVRNLAGTNSLEFLAERFHRGLSVQDQRFRDQSREIDMIRYPMTNGFWLETNDPALVKLMQRQQAGIVPNSKGTTRAVRAAFAVFIAATLFPLAFLLRNRVRRRP